MTNNRNKWALMLVALLALSACNQPMTPEQQAAYQERKSEAASRPIPETNYVSRLGQSGELQLYAYFVDPDTGCEYLVGGGITPRVGTKCFPLPPEAGQ